MVFRMLKGLKRLMLTTGLMCGVGLFLCATDVKAAITATIGAGDSEGDFKVNVTSSELTDDIANVYKIELYSGSTLAYTADYTGAEYNTPANTDTPITQNLTAGAFIDGSGISGLVSSGSSITIDGAKVYYNKSTSGTGVIEGTGTASSKPIYKAPVVFQNKFDTAATEDMLVVNVGEKTRSYGYGEETFSVTSNVPSNSYYEKVYENTSEPDVEWNSTWEYAGGTYPGVSFNSTSKLYFNYMPRIDTIKLIDRTAKEEIPTELSLPLESNTDPAPFNRSYGVKVLPIASGDKNENAVKNIPLTVMNGNAENFAGKSINLNSAGDELTISLGSTSKVLIDEKKEGKLSNVGVAYTDKTGMYTFPYNVIAKLKNQPIEPSKIYSGELDDENYNVSLTMKDDPKTVKLFLGPTGVDQTLLTTDSVKITNINELKNVKAKLVPLSGDSKLGLELTPLKATERGVYEVIKLKYNDDAAITCSINATVTDEPVTPTGVVLYYSNPEDVIDTKVPIKMSKGSDLSINMLLTPAGVDASEYDYITVSSSADNKVKVNYKPGDIYFKLDARDYTPSTIPAKIKIMYEHDSAKFEELLYVSVTDDIDVINKTNTKDAINKSEYNHITIGDDFSFDLEKLLLDYARDDNNSEVKNAKITNIKFTSNEDYISKDGLKIKGKKAGDVKLSATYEVAGTSVTVDDIVIGVYPMPTAEYKDRTVALTLPGKVATSYKGDNTISEVKGFKIALTDGSGNVLYEYDASKYQTVLSDSSSTTKTYTVSASDIEAMVTNAASAGKFAADTTSVQFRVIPMGYKPLKSDKSITTASDKIKATCQTTVYRVSAVGENIAPSYAYGLDGQTVQLTANVTDPTKYAFKQWQDNSSASNPRSIKISASGNRNYQAVAGARNGSGAGNGTGTGSDDNSELYDKVPKTAESNSAIWLIIFMVFAVMGTTYALYLQLRAASSKNDK